jgi:hypothetical protein
MLPSASKFKGSAPVASNTTPIANNTTPVTSNTTPVASDTVSVANDVTPITSDTAPVANDTTLVANDMTPVVNDTTLVASDTVSITNDTTPIASDTTPIVDVASGTPMLHHKYGYELPKIERSLFLPITITGHETKALVDNGTEIDIINTRLVERWKLSLQSIRNLNIEGIQ